MDEKQYCPACGKELAKTAIVCPHCGSPTALYHEQQAARAADPEVSPCRKSVTLILCILLGVIGGHRFYTGRILSGVLSLFYGAAWVKIFLIDRAGVVQGAPAITVFFAVILPLWWLVDVIRITTGYYTDKAGRRISE